MISKKKHFLEVFLITKQKEAFYGSISIHEAKRSIFQKHFYSRSRKKQNMFSWKRKEAKFQSKKLLTIIAVSYQSKILMMADWLRIFISRAERLDLQVTLEPADAVATSILWLDAQWGCTGLPSVALVSNFLAFRFVCTEFYARLHKWKEQQKQWISFNHLHSWRC